MHAHDMTIIINTTRGTTERTSMKIDFLIVQLGMVLQSNGLMLNADKMELLRTTTSQQLVANGRERLILKTKNKKGENIRPWSWTKILGMCFDANLTFKSHFEVGEHAMIPKLKKKLGALKFLGRKMMLKQGKKMADGVLMSGILYWIKVWGKSIVNI